MSNFKNKLTCAEANDKDLVEYLSSLGFKPARIIHADYWYYSPFRDEQTPSFKVNRNKNVWYDHGEGTGGSLIDFGLRHFNCQIPEFLEKLSSGFLFHQPVHDTPAKAPHLPESRLQITAVQPINSLGLLLYLKDRRIDFSIATRYCKQVVFEIDSKPMKALGFINDNGGFELRNTTFKGSSSPKAPTTFKTGAGDLNVFEGFFDFLSFQMMNSNPGQASADSLILNSTAFFEKSRPFMENYASVKLFLDRDPTGEKYTRQALDWGSKYEDHSLIYKGHTHLNDWIKSMGKSELSTLKPRLR